MIVLFYSNYHIMLDTICVSKFLINDIRFSELVLIIDSLQSASVVSGSPRDQRFASNPT